MTTIIHLKYIYICKTIKKYIHHPLKSTEKQSEKFTLKFLLFCRTSIITFIITTHGRGICKLFHCYECSTKKQINGK